MNDNFELVFLKECAENPGEFKTITAGDAIERDECSLHLKHLPIMHQQNDAPLCVLFSFLSALALYGDDVAVTKLLLLQSEMLDTVSVEGKCLINHSRMPL